MLSETSIKLPSLFLFNLNQSTTLPRSWETNPTLTEINLHNRNGWPSYVVYKEADLLHFSPGFQEFHVNKRS